MFDRQYYVCHNTLDWTGPMNTNLFNEISAAMSDDKPVENITSLCAIEMWHKTRNPMWIKVWIYLNNGSYSTVHTFSQDLMEVFDF